MLVLAVIAFGLIKALMSVVARDEAADINLISDYSSPYGYDPTIEVRARVHDDARGFLMPAADDPADQDPAAAIAPDSSVDAFDTHERSRSRSAARNTDSDTA